MLLLLLFVCLCGSARCGSIRRAPVGEQQDRLQVLSEWGSRWAEEQLATRQRRDELQIEVLVPDEDFALLSDAMGVRAEGFDDREINELLELAEEYGAEGTLLDSIIFAAVSAFKARRVELAVISGANRAWRELEERLPLFSEKSIKKCEGGVCFFALNVGPESKGEFLSLLANVLPAQEGVSISFLGVDLDEFPAFFGMFHCRLQAIHFEHCTFVAGTGPVFPANFLGTFPRLTEFKWRQSSGVEGVLESLQRFPATLEGLDLSYNQFDGAQLKTVAGIVRRQQSLVALNLAGAGMIRSNSAPLVEAILEAPKVRRLDLSSNAIGCVLLERLADRPSPLAWKHLDLGCTGLTDDARWEGLGKLPRLTELSVDSNQTTMTEDELKSRYCNGLSFCPQFF